MPLKKGKSKKVMGENYNELSASHPEMPKKQKVAIMLNEARKSGSKIKKKG